MRFHCVISVLLIFVECRADSCFALHSRFVPKPQWSNLESCFVPFHSVRWTKQLPSRSREAKWATFPHIPRLHNRFSLRAREDEIPEMLPPRRNTQQFLIFITVYIIVPFLISTILNIENDSYQFAKQQYNSAMTSTGFDPKISPSGSAEYMAMSNLYNESMQSLFVLLLSKRLALYFLATVATVYAGWRSFAGITSIRSGLIGGPGEALDRLDKEVLKGEQFDASKISVGGTEADETKNEEDNLFATLIDQNPQSSTIGQSIAIILPLVLFASLGASYLIIVLGSSNTAIDPTSDNLLSQMKRFISPYYPYLTTLPSLVLCLLFLCAEFRRVLPSTGSSSEPDSTSNAPVLCPGNVLASLYVMGAILAKTYPTIGINEQSAIPISIDLWPLQNGVNIALAATVTRALAPFLVPTTPASNKSIRTVALALIGVALFDGISVFGTVVNAAIDSASEASVMEVVARSKLASGSQTSGLIPWQPGLLEIIIGHDNRQASEALGLGDVVFPACLIAWAWNADVLSEETGSRDAAFQYQYTSSAAFKQMFPDALSELERLLANEDKDATTKSPFKYQYTISATLGYVVASLVMEVIGSFSLLGNRGGLPALVFLVPAMLAFVTVVAWRKGELDEVWGDD